MARSTDLVAALDAATTGGNTLKIDSLYGDQPDVLAAIKRARDRGNGPAGIAARLNVDLAARGERISKDAVETWLKANP